MSLCADFTVAAMAGQQRPGTVRLAGALSLGCSMSGTGKTTLTFVGELDAASADQAYEYVRDAIDTHGGDVLLDVAGLSFCDARGLGALARMSSHAEQEGSSLHLVAPRPLLVKIIRITGLGGRLPVQRGDLAGRVALARPRRRPVAALSRGSASPWLRAVLLALNIEPGQARNEGQRS